MKTKNIILFFSTIFLIVCVVLILIFYFFIKAKSNIETDTILLYRNNSAKLISDRIYDDLLIDNDLEASRKLNLIKESKIISDFKIIKSSSIESVNTKYYCENIYFDKLAKKTKWGQVCISFDEEFKKKSFIDLRDFSLIFLYLSIFTVFIIIFLFKTITNLNKKLYKSLHFILVDPNSIYKHNFLWSPVLEEIKKLVSLNQENENKLFTQKIEQEKINIAAQVAHDIRSPLSVLESIDFSRIEVNQDVSLAKDAIYKISNIANTLLTSGRDIINQLESSSFSVQQTIDNLTHFKQREFPLRKIKVITHKNFYIYANEVKFHSILSNLINNSFEASPVDSVVIITICSDEKNTILIEDKGKGIHPDLLMKLGKEKITWGKLEGNGLGILSSVQAIKDWGGELSISSEMEIGTKIKIIFPKNYEIPHSSLQVLLDNDELVRLTWQYRAKKIGINLLTFTSSAGLIKDLNNFSLETFFYIDSELDDEKGENVAKYLFDKGYKNLFMCSGYSKEKFKDLLFIKDVINKSPPW